MKSGFLALNLPGNKPRNNRNTHGFSNRSGSGVLIILIAMLLMSSGAADAQGTWRPVATPAPNYNAGVMILMSDGTVLCKNSNGGDTYGNGWDKLIPDINGSYINGTWSNINFMMDSRLYFSSRLLKDGRLYIAGGEYGSGRAKAEIYDPTIDWWFQLPAFIANDTISDANSELLPNGKVLQAVVISGVNVSKRTYIFDPLTSTFSLGGVTRGGDDESSWVKLPDNTILYVDIFSTNSERYNPVTNTWIPDASLPVELYDPYGYETGAGFLMPDGRVFFLGASGQTAYYTPSGSTSPGTWAAGPVIPDSLGAPDAAAAMMVNGKILCAFSPVPKLDSVFQVPYYFYEFNYLTDSFTKIPTPLGVYTYGKASYITNMLCLPDGNILFSSQGSDEYFIYTPDGVPLAAGKPTVDSIFKISCDTFMATGKLFNGISEGAGYGDDWQMATNYPIIRLSYNDSIYYTRTFNWNSTGVMRGSKPDTTYFVLPAGLPDETYALRVSANGIASDSVLFSTCAVTAIQNVHESASGITVYPNPAHDQATITFNGKASGRYDLRLFDVFGRLVKGKTGVEVAGKNNCAVSLDGIKSGVYSIIITDGNGVYTTRLTIN